MMENDTYDTNMIWEFYLKYIVKNIKELESVQFKTPQHDIIKRVLNIIEFDEKVLNDKIQIKHEIGLFHM